jgi:hypothetical protein
LLRATLIGKPFCIARHLIVYDRRASNRWNYARSNGNREDAVGNRSRKIPTVCVHL